MSGMSSSSGTSTLVLGFDNTAQEIVRAMLDDEFPSQITVCDPGPGTDRRVQNVFGDRVQIRREDLPAMTEDELRSHLRRYDYIIDTLPARQSLPIVQAAAKTTGAKLISTSHIENPMSLDRTALQKCACVVPNCGVSPGLSHGMASHAIDQIRTKAPGLPVKVGIVSGSITGSPVTPFQGMLTRDAADFLAEYITPAWVRRGHQVTKVDPLDSIEQRRLMEHAVESFPVSSLGSLFMADPWITDMEVRRLCTPGHLAFMRALRTQTGLFGTDTMAISGLQFSLHEILAAWLKERFGNRPCDDTNDTVLMEVSVEGSKDRTGSIVQRYKLPFDTLKGTSSMARAEVATVYSVLRFFGYQRGSLSGVFPLERLVPLEPEIYDRLLAAHRTIGATIEIESHPPENRTV